MMNLDQLPKDVFGHILDQLNQITGSRGFINDCDIPYIAKYAANLACTSKKMASLVTNLDVTNIFLQSLAEKYAMSCQTLAATINFNCHRRWLWNYIKKNELDKAYQTIQEIIKIGLEIFEEAKDAGFLMEDLDLSTSKPNYNHMQTKGFGLLFDPYIYIGMTTPFGNIDFNQVTNTIREDNSRYSIIEMFIKRLHAQFDQSIEFCSDFSDGGIYEVKTSSLRDIIREVKAEDLNLITKEEEKALKGTKNVIMHTRDGTSSFYPILEVNGKLQKMSNIGSDCCLGSKIAKTAWKMLEAAALGKDPILKKVKNKKPLAVKTENDPPLFTHISEVLDWAMQIMTNLFSQPLQTLDGRSVKVLTLNDKAANAITALNEAAFATKKELKWLLSNSYRQKICLYLNQFENLERLKVAYELALIRLSKIWVKAELKDHSTIKDIKSEEGFVLFVNKGEANREDYGLMYKLISNFNFSEFVHPGGLGWGNGPFNMNLWIRKDKLDVVLKAFNISM